MRCVQVIREHQASLLFVCAHVCMCEKTEQFRDYLFLHFWHFMVFESVFVCVTVTICTLWVMGFVHPLLLTARMYPWQRQVDPSCELVRGTWKGALNLSSHLPCALLTLTMSKRVALLKSQPSRYVWRHIVKATDDNSATFWPHAKLFTSQYILILIFLFRGFWLSLRFICWNKLFLLKAPVMDFLKILFWEALVAFWELMVEKWGEISEKENREQDVPEVFGFKLVIGLKIIITFRP